MVSLDKRNGLETGRVGKIKESISVIHKGGLFLPFHAYDTLDMLITLSYQEVISHRTSVKGEVFIV